MGLHRTGWPTPLRTLQGTWLRRTTSTRGARLTTPGFASTAAEGLFPPHVRTPEAALDYLSTWCDIIGGELLDGIEWEEIADATGRLAVLRVPPFRIGFRVGTVLTIAINMDADLAAHFYKFDFRLTGGALCWRHDCHAGHESLGAGPYHRHLGPAGDHRVADQQQTLQTIFEHVTAGNLQRSWRTD